MRETTPPMKKQALFILLLLLLIYRPTFNSFLVYSNSNLKLILLRFTSLFLGSTNYYNFYLFSIIFRSIPSSHHLYLGILGNWFDLSDLLITSIPSIKCSFPCSNGVCYIDKKCICFPSWTGSSCSEPVIGFQSLWSVLAQSTSIRQLYRKNESCILGIPYKYFNSQIIELSEALHFSNITLWVGILEFILFLNILIYILWLVFPNTFMDKHFTNSWHGVVYKKRFVTLLSSLFSHHSITYLTHTLFSFLSYAPLLVSIIGTKNFTILYILTGLISQSSSLFWRRLILYDGIWTRSNGGGYCILGLRTFLLYKEYMQYGYLSTSSINSIFAFIIMEYLLAFSNVNLGGHVGAIFSGIMFYRWIIE